jgi:hypothetical protein
MVSRPSNLGGRWPFKSERRHVWRVDESLDDSDRGCLPPPTHLAFPPSPPSEWSPVNHWRLNGLPLPQQESLMNGKNFKVLLVVHNL